MRKNPVMTIAAFVLLAIVSTFTAACSGEKGNPFTPSTESAAVAASTQGGNNPTAGPAPTGPTNPGAPTTPTPPGSTLTCIDNHLSYPLGGSGGDTRRFEPVRPSEDRAAVLVTNKGPARCEVVGGSFQITRSDDHLQGQIKNDQHPVVIESGDSVWITVKIKPGACNQFDIGRGTSMAPPPHSEGAKPFAFAFINDVKVCTTEEPPPPTFPCLAKIAPLSEDKTSVSGSMKVTMRIHCDGGAKCRLFTRIANDDQVAGKEVKDGEIVDQTYRFGDNLFKVVNTLRVQGSDGKELCDSTYSFDVPAKQPEPPAPDKLVCIFPSQAGVVNQTVNMAAAGGNGTYNWDAPGGNPPTGTGHTFQVKYDSEGEKTATVRSGDQTTTCKVLVTKVEPPPPPPNVCEGTSGKLTKSPSFETDGVTYTHPTQVTLTGTNVRGAFTQQGGNPINVTNNQTIPVKFPHPPNGSGTTPFGARLDWFVGDKQCGSDPVSYDVPERPREPTCPDLNLELTIVSVEYPANQPGKAIITVRLNWTGGQDAGLITRDSVESKPIMRGTTTSFTVDQQTQLSDFNFKGEAKTTSGTTCPITKKVTIQPKEQTCEQQYPTRLDSASGYAQMINPGSAYITAKFFAQNVSGRTFAIRWYSRGGKPNWLKVKINLNQQCGLGQEMTISYTATDPAHLQQNGAKWELWEVAYDSPLLTENFTPIRHVVDLDWR